MAHSHAAGDTCAQAHYPKANFFTRRFQWDVKIYISVIQSFDIMTTAAHTNFEKSINSTPVIEQSPRPFYESSCAALWLSLGLARHDWLWDDKSMLKPVHPHHAKSEHPITESMRFKILKSDEADWRQIEYILCTLNRSKMSEDSSGMERRTIILRMIFRQHILMRKLWTMSMFGIATHFCEIVLSRRLKTFADRCGRRLQKRQKYCRFDFGRASIYPAIDCSVDDKLCTAAQVRRHLPA